MNSLRSIGVWQFVVVLVFLIISGVNPHDRFTWLLEVSWVGVGLILVVSSLQKRDHPNDPAGMVADAACHHPDIRRVAHVRKGSSRELDEGGIRF